MEQARVASVYLDEKCKPERFPAGRHRHIRWTKDLPRLTDQVNVRTTDTSIPPVTGQAGEASEAAKEKRRKAFKGS